MRGLPVIATARHGPQEDRPPELFLDVLDRHGITHALLTAPSFFGSDNSYLLSVLDQYPARLRGTVIVEPDTGRAALESMAKRGVVGIRLNWFNMAAIPDVATPAYRKLFGHVAQLDWHVEIYLEGPKLAQVLPRVLETGAKAVVDHFGSPDPGAGVDDAGFRVLLKALEAGRTWVKLTAPYRLGGADAGVYAAALLERGGPQRLLWGSDWPWTQNMAGKTYQLTLDWLAQWVPDEAQRAVILGSTAAALCKFD